MPTKTTQPCRWCGAPVQQRSGPGRPKRYCKPSHKVRAHQWKLKSGSDLSLYEIAERCDFRCGGCGDLVDMEVPFDEPMGATIDHEVPQANGGSNLELNLQLMHRRCNVRKRAEMPATTGDMLIGEVRPGQRILIGDGKTILTVEAVDTWHHHVRVRVAGLPFPLLVPPGEIARVVG